MTKYLQVVLLSLSAILPLAATAQVSQNLSLQLGPTIILPIGANQSAIAIADLNLDNRGDVAVCQKGLNSIGVYLQTATGTFPTNPTGTYPAGTAPSGLVAVPLSNLTTHPAYDLVAVSGPSSKWTLLQNNGQGVFTALIVSSPFGTGAISTNPKLAAAYLNRDNYIDFAYTYDGPQQYSVSWQAYGGGSSFPNQGSSVLTYSFVPPSFTMVDFDRDGYLDVTFPNPSTNQFWVVFASQSVGSTNWLPNNALLTLASGGTQPVDVAAGDVNNDSQPDIAVANAGSSNITLFLNTGTYQFGSPVSYSLSAAPRRVLLEDLNGDNYPEMITITADNKLQVFRHTGATGSSRYGIPQTLATGVDPTLLQLADMDGDQIKDIVVGCSGDNTVRVYLNRSLAALATAAPQLAGVSVYPNPATDQLHIEARGTSEPLQAVLLDVTGRTVREVTLRPTDLTLSVADLPRGLYLLRLTGSTGSGIWRVALH